MSGRAVARRPRTDVHPGRRSPRQGLRRAADAPAAGVPAPVQAGGGRRRPSRSSRGSALQLAQPYLMKVAIDRYIARQRRCRDSTWSPSASWPSCSARSCSSTSRPTSCSTSGSGSCSTCGCRSTGTCSALDIQYYDRNPVGRLMTRVTTDVDVLNDLFASGVVTVVRRRLHAGRDHGRPAER